MATIGSGSTSIGSLSNVKRSSGPNSASSGNQRGSTPIGGDDRQISEFMQVAGELSIQQAAMMGSSLIANLQDEVNND